MPEAAATDVLPADSALGPAQLRVSELARSRDWCERVLGMRALRETAASVELGCADGTPLVRLRGAPVRPLPPRGLRGLYHHALLLPSRAQLGAFVRHLRETGVPFGASDHWFSEAVYLTDPDGLTVEVYADRPRAEWRWQGRDIVGAVDPLDERAVLAAAGPEAWQGLPAGTVMGHLHFFVGDLGTAETFYVRGLGFEPSTRLFRGALFVAAGGYHHHLGLNVWAAGQPVAGPGDAGLDVWELKLPSEAARAALEARALAAGLSREAGADLVYRDDTGLRVQVTVA